MRCAPPKLTLDDVPRPVLPEGMPNEHKSLAPPVVVECWWGMVERMNRKALDRFTRDTVNSAILRRRRTLASPLRP